MPEGNYQRFVVDINPIPWKVPPFSAGRGKGRGIYVKAGRDAELHAYEEAVRDECLSQGAFVMPGPYMIQLWFSRNTADKVHAADITNLQKSTEDALQGAVIENDTDTVEIFSHRVLQGETAPGFIVIQVWGEHRPEVPKYIRDIIIEKINVPEITAGDNQWPPRS